MRRAVQLHQRLAALGLDVYEPERIWIGRCEDVDNWRWQAGEAISGGTSFVGSEHSMAECLAMDDEELKLAISHSCGYRFFYPNYADFAAACRRYSHSQASAG